VQIAQKPELQTGQGTNHSSNEQGISHAFLSYTLIRPAHPLRQIARADGKEVVGFQSCSSEHAKDEKRGAKAVLENINANEINEPHT